MSIERVIAGGVSRLRAHGVCHVQAVMEEEQASVFMNMLVFVC